MLPPQHNGLQRPAFGPARMNHTADHYGNQASRPPHGYYSGHYGDNTHYSMPHNARMPFPSPVTQPLPPYGAAPTGVVNSNLPSYRPGLRAPFSHTDSPQHSIGGAHSHMSLVVDDHPRFHPGHHSGMHDDGRCHSVPLQQMMHMVENSSHMATQHSNAQRSPSNARRTQQPPPPQQQIPTPSRITGTPHLQQDLNEAFAFETNIADVLIDSATTPTTNPVPSPLGPARFGSAMDSAYSPVPPPLYHVLQSRGVPSPSDQSQYSPCRYDNNQTITSPASRVPFWQHSPEPPKVVTDLDTGHVATRPTELPIPKQEIKQEVLESPGTNSLLQQVPPSCALAHNDTSKRAFGDPYLSNPSLTQSAKPCIEIVEQPRARGLRFRYKCEGRSAGTIPGENSTNENRTYPTIRINNYSGPSAIVVVSCVTKDEPQPRPHPHALVGKDCKEGVCTVKLKGTNQISFPSLGIQCATKKEVGEALKQREKIRVDPWGRGYHENVNNIELGQVRLAFQAFLPDESGKYTRIVPPVYSQLIYDKKSVSDLVICRLSRQSGSVDGGDEIFLLCEKVNKEDIHVRFFETNKHEGLVWEAFGSFGPQDVHRQVAIVFKTPMYRDREITTPTEVFIQLRRPSDDEQSDPKPFQYIPHDPDPDNVFKKRKRKNVDFKAFLSDVPFNSPSPFPNNTKDALKHKILGKSGAKRGKPSGAFAQEMETSQDSYTVYPDSAANQNPSMLSGLQYAPGVNMQWSDVTTQPGMTSHVTTYQTNSETYVTIPPAQPLQQQAHKMAPPSLGGPAMGGDGKLVSLSQYLPDGFDPGMSLPSLPSIGETFPGNMQVPAAQDVAAEETVQSTETAEHDPDNQPNTQASNQPGNDITAASLDRRIGDSMDKLQGLSKP